tara:strand:+ start:69 stop:581 length:513 start_codon:yes stop_codon:yes gene_type:complete
MAWEFLVSTGFSLYTDYKGAKSARNLINNIKPGIDTAAADINKATSNRMAFARSEQNRINRLNLPMGTKIADKLSSQMTQQKDQMGGAQMVHSNANTMYQDAVDQMGVATGQRETNLTTDERQTSQNILDIAYQGKSAYNQIMSEAYRAGYTQAGAYTPWTASGYQTSRG